MRKNHKPDTLDSRLNRVRHIIWDFDGTLFDTYPAIAHAFRLAIRDLGGDMPEPELLRMAKASLDLDHYISMIISRCGIGEKELLETFRKRQALLSPENDKPFPGARDLCIHILQKGGMNFLSTHRGKQSAFNLLDQHGMRNLFTTCLFTEDGFQRKPHPEMFNIIIERNNLNRDEVLVIGDRELDIQAGKAAGTLTCLYGERISDSYGADLFISNYRVLSQRLSGGNG